MKYGFSQQDFTKYKEKVKKQKTFLMHIWVNDMKADY